MKLFRKGEGQAARRREWAFMEKFEVPYFDEPFVNYLTRWRIIQTPWFAIYLHRFDRPDSRPTLHDHPWSFLSIILRGGYVERRLNRRTMEVDEHHMVRRVNFAPIGMTHSIRRLLRQPTWSLVFVGPRRQTWGYWRSADFIRNGKHYTSWHWCEFDKDVHNDEFEKTMKTRNELFDFFDKPISDAGPRSIPPVKTEPNAFNTRYSIRDFADAKHILRKAGLDEIAVKFAIRSCVNMATACGCSLPYAAKTFVATIPKEDDRGK